MSFTQKVRADIIASCYERWDIRGKKVLDVGCGNGVVTRVLRDRFELIVEITDVAHYAGPDLSFVPMSGPARIPHADNSFEIAMLNDVLHHAADPGRLLREVKRIAPVILVFEDVGTLLMKAIDRGANPFYLKNMICPLAFKSEAGWRAIFEKCGLSSESLYPKCPWWWPARHMAFRLRSRAD